MIFWHCRVFAGPLIAGATVCFSFERLAFYLEQSLGNEKAPFVLTYKLFTFDKEAY